MRHRTGIAMGVLAALLLCLASPCRASERKRSKRLWWASVAAVVAASALDVVSSRGGVETNPLLRKPDGTFNARRAVLFKSIAAGGLLATEAWVLRRSPGSRRGAAAVNFAVGGAVAALAVRNWRVSAQPGSQ